VWQEESKEVLQEDLQQMLIESFDTKFWIDEYTIKSSISEFFWKQNGSLMPDCSLSIQKLYVRNELTLTFLLRI